MSPHNNLHELLQHAANHGSSVGIVAYESTAEDTKPVSITYQELLDTSNLRSRQLQACKNPQSGSIVLLQVDHPLESLLWFWAIVEAGLIPCISPPPTKDPEQQKKQIEHLKNLLQHPFVITTEELLPTFSNIDDLDIRTPAQILALETINDTELKVKDHFKDDKSQPVQDLPDSFRDIGPYITDHAMISNYPATRSFTSEDERSQSTHCSEAGSTGTDNNVNMYQNADTGYTTPEIALQNYDSSGPQLSPATDKHLDDIAVLMLTSGSTGNAKAVPLRHGQILQAIEGKSEYHGTTSSDIFMNWVGLDHVANLTEIHLQAMSLCAQQVHLPKDIVGEPLRFLDVVAKHKVSYTFAPNFFLASLTRALTFESLNCQGSNIQAKSRDLSSLRALISGGESNLVETCVTLTQKLEEYEAPKSFIRPGFGMTETCAGSIYSKNCPLYDLKTNSEFASLGDCIPGISMRITTVDHINAEIDEIGALEIKGPIVFEGYYNNGEATLEAFTDDQWFKTGDLARIDASGFLHITGREKETIVVNGINHSPQAIEAAIEEAKIPGLISSFTVVFGHRPKDSPTEVLCIVYLPNYASDHVSAHFETSVAISKEIITYCGVRPYKIIPLEPSLLVKSSLGKLSRTKVRKAFEAGEYQKYEDEDSKIIKTHRLAVLQSPTTETQSIILDICRDLFGAKSTEFGIGNSLFELGVSSIDLLKLGQKLHSKVHVELPLNMFFAYPEIKDLAEAIENLQKAERVYESAVILHKEGENIPLWFIHPGVGEVLIFMNLARYITDRPLYALRARGFDGEPYFETMEEMTETYLTSIKRVQPQGPYAICGYSFGSIITFEISKRLESQGDEVKFIGVLDQPPHFKKRAAGYDWYEVACTLAFFLDLSEEWYAYDALAEFRRAQTPRAEVIAHFFESAPVSRIQELGLTKQRFENWANLAFQLKIISRNYDPSGSVQNMDVFYVPPLPIVEANTTEEWLDGFIGKWQNFSRDVKFHLVDGGHRTLISPPHVISFQKLLKSVLKERGI